MKIYLRTAAMIGVLFGATVISSCDGNASFRGSAAKRTEKNSGDAKGAKSDPLPEPGDTTGPTVTIDSAAPETTNAPIPVTVTVSEDHKPLTPADVKVSGGVIEDFKKEGNTYTFKVVPSGDGPVTISIEGGVVKDIAGNGNPSTITITRTFAGSANLVGSAEASNAHTENSVWVVNSGGVAHKITLDPDNNYPMKQWTGAGGGGHRTFVSAIGLLIGTNGGYIYRADDSVPVAGVAQQIYKADADSGSRTCVTAFRDPATGQEYVGAGFHKNNKRLFVKIPMKADSPTKVDAAAAQVFDAGAGVWGYSCYTDQGRNYFWSKNNSTGGGISGVNMLTGAPVALTAAPNAAHKISVPGVLTFDLAGGGHSYAMSGGGAGLLISAGSVYTAALETASNMAYISSGSKLILAKTDCLVSDVSCAGKIWAFDMTGVGLVKPLSSLNDGRILGIQRGSPSSVFIISLKDAGDPSLGVKATKIKEVPGDAYMYTDFTGATAYAKTIVAKIDLKSVKDYKAGATFSSPAVTWRSNAGDGDAWRGLNMSVRCFKAADAAPPAFAPVSNVQAAGTHVNVTAPSCAGVYDTVEIKIESDGAADFSRTKSVDFFVQR